MTALSSKSHDASSAEPIEHESRPPLSLSNGRLSVVIARNGAGHTLLENAAVTRASNGLIGSPKGFFLYLRDCNSPRFWSPTPLPTLLLAEEQFAACYRQGQFFLRCVVDGLDMELAVAVDASVDAELRRLRITNHSPHQQRIEVTSYLEPVLGDARLDASHPAFSKLFLETSWHPQHGALVARRRRRAIDEPCLTAAHLTLGAAGCEWDDRIEYETDRARFTGRGRNLANPAAMYDRHGLSETVGSVLDPIMSLRRFFSIDPGATAEITLALVAAEDPALLDNQVQQLLARSADELFPSTESGGNVPAASRTVRIDSPREQLPTVVMRALVADSKSKDAKRRYRPPDPASEAEDDPAVSGESLLFDNGWGGFAADGREYVIRLRPLREGGLRLPPMPWTNVVANEVAGFIATETGAGCTWVSNSRENCLTPWSNDPISDPHGEALYIRDEAAGVYWSPVPGPVPAGSSYEIRHGLGYTRWRHRSYELLQEVVQFVPRSDPVKVSVLRLRNESDRPRSLSVFAYQRWNIVDRHSATTATTTAHQEETRAAIMITGRGQGTFASRVSFAAVGHEGSDEIVLGNNADEFIGSTAGLEAPAAVAGAARLGPVRTTVENPCVAMQLHLMLPPGSERELVFLLGEAENERAAGKLIEHLCTSQAADAALTEVSKFWQEVVSVLQVDTPSPALNLLVNAWLPYQTVSCRLWGRSSFYQGGGAYGFRDQLQDAAACIYHDPTITRQQIVQHAAHQYVEGDVLHWWHPDTGPGLRTRFADDLLWLPLVASEYVATTGDHGLWHEEVGYQKAAPLDDGETERLVPLCVAPQSGTLYDHCCRAIDCSLKIGAHGLPLMGGGDWNDGMNRVGVGGAGESVWLGFFLYDILGQMVPVCRRLGDTERAHRYSAQRQQLGIALNKDGWDGQWYRRAFFDDGTPLGSAASNECRIDALVQAWAVLSGAAPADRARQAVQAVEAHLVDEAAGIIRLLTPPFDRMEHDPGYIKGYLPGVRENGGQYTHGVLWYIRALAELGEGTRATKLLEMLTPIRHTQTAQQVAVYQTEPYVVAADVCGEPPHIGRGGWSWYTGSAGWMLRVIVESLLGLRIENGETMLLHPTISSGWPTCVFQYRHADTTYRITIDNPHRREQGASTGTLDGQSVEVCGGTARVPLRGDGQTHDLIIHM